MTGLQLSAYYGDMVCAIRGCTDAMVICATLQRSGPYANTRLRTHKRKTPAQAGVSCPPFFVFQGPMGSIET
jgi:hypothetical protein